MKKNLFWASVHLGMAALWYFLWIRFPDIARENSWMEMFEAACLMAGGALLILALRTADDSGRKIFCFGLFLGYFTALVLEVDTRIMNVPPWITRATNGEIRNLWLGVLWAAGAVWFLRKPRQSIAVALVWLRSPAARLFFLAAVFWGAADAVEKVFQADIFYEEILECVGALLMAQCAWQTLSQTREAARALP